LIVSAPGLVESHMGSGSSIFPNEFFSGGQDSYGQLKEISLQLPVHFGFDPAAGNKEPRSARGPQKLQRDKGQ